MNYEVDFSTRSIVISFAKACYSAIVDYDFELVSWFESVLKTDLFNQYEYAFDVYSQAPTYIVNQFLEDEHSTVIAIATAFQINHKFSFGDIAYWMGYVFMSWKLVDNIKGISLLSYNLEEIEYSYDCLHTQSITYAIDTIKENYFKEEAE